MTFFQFILNLCSYYVNIRENITTLYSYHRTHVMLPLCFWFFNIYCLKTILLIFLSFILTCISHWSDSRWLWSSWFFHKIKVPKIARRSICTWPRCISTRSIFKTFASTKFPCFLAFILWEVIQTILIITRFIWSWSRNKKLLSNFHILKTLSHRWNLWCLWIPKRLLND